MPNNAAAPTVPCTSGRGSHTETELRRMLAQLNQRKGADKAGRRPATSPAQDAEIRRRRAAGDTLTAIARDLGVSIDTVRRRTPKEPRP